MPKKNTALTAGKQLHGWPRFYQEFLTELQEGKSATAGMEQLRWAWESLIPGPASRRILQLLSAFSDAPLPFLSGAAGITLRETWTELIALLELGCVVGTYAEAEWWVALSPGFAGLGWSDAILLNEKQLEGLQVLYARSIGERKSIEALAMLLQMSDLRHANEFAIRQFARLTLRHNELFLLLQEIPMKRLEGHPGLLDLALTVTRPNLTVPIEEVDMLAAKLLEAAVDERGSVPETMGITELAFVTGAERMLGRWDRALTHARQLERELAAFEDRHEWQSWSALPTIYAVVSLVGNLTGDYSLALRAVSRVRQIATAEGNVAEEIRAGYQGALTYAQLMDFPSAARKLSAVEVLHQQTGVESPEFGAASRLIAHIWVHLWEGDFEAAKEVYAQSAELLVRMEQWPLFAQAESWLTLLMKGPRAARELLHQRILSRPKDILSPHMDAMLTARLATLAILDGDIAAGRKLLEASASRSPAVFAANARLALIKGDLVRAEDQIERARYLTTGPADGTDICLLAAVIRWESGDREEAFTLLKQIETNLNSQKNPFLLTEVPYQSLLALARAAAAERAADVLEAVEGLRSRWRWQVPDQLTPAETKALSAVRNRGTVPKAAELLGASPNTVKAHVRKIYRKLGVSSRPEMLYVAERGDLMRTTLLAAEVSDRR